MSNNEFNVSTDLISQLIKEKRSEKRWKNIRFFTALFIIFFIILGVFSANTFVNVGGPQEGKGYVAYIKLNGMIETGREFSAENVIPQLREAFSDANAKGVILNINSGGGTPVQASIIYDAIVNFKNIYRKKVVVVGEDIVASGAYYVAVAADKIYVNPNTITGSIGVIMKGFGFTDLLKKVGVDRRVYTSGVNKDRLDPFLPQTKEDVEKVHTVIKEVHDNFNQVVLAGRKGKLRAKPEEVFTGDFWSGESALKLGLVDGLGNLTDVMRKEFNVSRYRDYSGSQGLLRSAMGQLGSSFDAIFEKEELKLMFG